MVTAGSKFGNLLLSVKQSWHKIISLLKINDYRLRQAIHRNVCKPVPISVAQSSGEDGESHPCWIQRLPDILSFVHHRETSQANSTTSRYKYVV